MDTPFLVFFITMDKAGVWFPYKGDEVLWRWPWRRKGLAPFTSTAFSGTGEWGDARFWSLRELDSQWEAYYTACEAAELMEGMELAGEVALDEGGNLVFKESDEAIRFFAQNAGMNATDVAQMANQTADKLRAIPPDEMERLGKAFDNINNRT